MQKPRETTQLFGIGLLTISILGMIVSTARAGMSGESDVPEPRKFAVLIAIDRYHDENISDLQYCKSDALALKKTLIAGGFQESNIILMTDDTIVPSLQPTKENIQNILAVLENFAKEGDMIFFHFSGQGASRNDGNSMLIPMDFEYNSDQLAGGLTVQEVLDTLGRCKAESRLVVLDMCLGGSNANPWILPNKTAILLAAKDGIAYESPELQGAVFTQYLIRGLQGEADKIGDENGKVDLTELFHYAKSQMAKQKESMRTSVPGLMVSSDGDDIFGLEIVDLENSVHKTGGVTIEPISDLDNRTYAEPVHEWGK